MPPIPLPLRMLAFIASPLDLEEQARLQIEREQELLLQAVNSPAGQGKLHVDFEDEAKLEILENSLESGYHILHYTGHGISPTEGGGLLLEDARGESRPAEVAEILQALQKAGGSLRLAVIAGCHTARTLHVGGFRDLSRGLARMKVPAVLAMQFSISDGAGLKFAETLYPRIANGQQLEMALSAVRRTLLNSGDPYLQADALAPVLITTNGLCLQTREREAAESTDEPVIDFSFHLPLPQLSFGFYGRRREYRQIRDGLLHQNHRAVILYGIGGIGKTALASLVATRLRSRFRGVYAFNCSSGTVSPERILHDLNSYFGRQGVNALRSLVQQQMAIEEQATYLAQLLSRWPLLLIFDNFESQLERTQSGFQVADERLREFIITLVKATAAATRFVFTSRYLFDLDSKRLGIIQELPLGDLSRPEALGLMQKLPHLSAASFDEKFTAFNTFGGHPYALVALDRHCSHRPLEKALEDAKALHAELREFLAIELNYSHLSARSRELLDRLSAFRKPIPSETAEWVMGVKIEAPEHILERIDRNKLPENLKPLDDEKLVKLLASLLPEERRAEPLDEQIAELISWGLLTPLYENGRLGMLAVHSLVRDFCRDQQNGETWRARLHDAAAFYTNSTKFLAQDEKEPTAVWNEVEALELLLDAGDYKGAVSLLSTATPLLSRWGFGRYCEILHRRVLPNVEGESEAVLCLNLSILLMLRRQDESAQTYAEKALHIYEKLGYKIGIAKTLLQIGSFHEARNDLDSAKAYFERSYDISKESLDKTSLALALGALGSVHRGRKEYEEALSKYEEARAAFENLNDRENLETILQGIGRIHLICERYNLALSYFTKALEIAEEINDRQGVASHLTFIGSIKVKHGDYDAALSCYDQALDIYEDLDDRLAASTIQKIIGEILTATGNYSLAFDFLLSSLTGFIALYKSVVGAPAKALKELRVKWGEEAFDAAWGRAVKGDIPDWLK